MPKLLLLLLSLFMAVAAPGVADENRSAKSGQKSGESQFVPWSGAWWPMLSGELVLGWESKSGRKRWNESDVVQFDSCLASSTTRCKSLMNEMAKDKGRSLSPLMKYDLFFLNYAKRVYKETLEADYLAHSARNELNIHYIGNNEKHRYWNSKGYAGKCIGWALANMDQWPEPTRELELEGVIFEPADIKGILATIYNGAQFFIPNSLVYGKEYHEKRGQNTRSRYLDVRPTDFLRALNRTIDNGKILEADLDPGDGVWNYPIYKYDLKWNEISAGKVEVVMTLFYADDEVDFDQVFSTNRSRPDLKSRNLTFSLNVPSGWAGDLLKATSGEWTGSSIGNHPDVVILGIEEGWKESILEYVEDDSTGNSIASEVNFGLLTSALHPRKVGGSLEDGESSPLVHYFLDLYYSR